MQFSIDCLLILFVTVAIVLTNGLTLLIVFKTEHLTFINRYFFVSMTVCDLCLGLFVTPFSFWTSLFGQWIYGEKFCHVEAYLAAIFWIASVYSLTWTSIDHYVAIRKPDRHDSLMTPMRSICWLTLIWVAAFSFCCPPLFGEERAKYYKEAAICVIDWNLQRAYVITSGLLIIVPPLLALSISNLYIFTSAYQVNKLVYEKCSDSKSRSGHYLVSFILGVLYLVCWLPWCSLQIYELIQTRLGGPLAPPRLHFYLIWLAISNSFIKFFVYVLLDADFRGGIQELASQLLCRLGS